MNEVMRKITRIVFVFEGRLHAPEGTQRAGLGPKGSDGYIQMTLSSNMVSKTRS